jgi:hypothetical protein
MAAPLAGDNPQNPVEIAGGSPMAAGRRGSPPASVASGLAFMDLSPPAARGSVGRRLTLLFGRYPTYSSYRFEERTVIALYSNTAAKKDLPAFEVANDSFLGQFLSADIEDLKRECRRRDPEELQTIIQNAAAPA